MKTLLLLVIVAAIILLAPQQQLVHGFVPVVPPPAQSPAARERRRGHTPRAIRRTTTASEARRLSRSSTSTSQLSMSVPNQLDVLTSGLASVCRFLGGVTVVEGRRQSASAPTPTIRIKQLYDIENSKECRVVREKLTELDLNVDTVIPAATGSRVFNDQSYEYSLPIGTTVPRMVVVDNDEQQSRVLSGAEDIINFLDSTFNEFGADAIAADATARSEDPTEIAKSLLKQVGGYAADLLRIGRGVSVSPAANIVGRSTTNIKPLTLYSYEGNQFCRLVREVLTELDLVYELRNVGKESSRRQNDMAKITPDGSTQCPYLIDPNTGISMKDSADIIQYLYKTYALYTPPNEILEWVSNVVLTPIAKPLFGLLAPLQAGSGRDDTASYEREISQARAEIEETIQEHDIVVYTYDWSPFSTETKKVLDNLEDVSSYKEISLGPEWIPGLIKEGGSQIRAALLEMTGQSSMPHIFVNGKSVGGLFSGTPGLLKAIEEGMIIQQQDGSGVASETTSL